MEPVEIKVLPFEYEPIVSGARPFVFSYKKLGIGIGDIIKLREYVHGVYTGREILKRASFVYCSDGAYGLLNIYTIICFKETIDGEINLSCDDSLESKNEEEQSADQVQEVPCR